jgi:hypothetical protein
VVLGIVVTVVEAVVMMIEFHRSVMSGRKTGMKIVGPTVAGNYAAWTVPVTWPVTMGGKGAILLERFRWISSIDQTELTSTRDRIRWRGRKEKDERAGTELNGCATRHAQSDATIRLHRSVYF